MRSLDTDNPKFLNQRILITCCWLSGWGGAEINILQLANQLKSYGATVDCFTYWLSEPMATVFKQKDINVIVDSFSHLDTAEKIKYTNLNLSDYDYIWICQQVMPISLIKQLRDASVLPRFIFLHMSALIGIPVEAPIVWNFERVVYDKILSISEDTTENIKRILGDNFSEISYYRNPAPPEYTLITRKEETLKKIAVISNHPPNELIDVEEYLRKKDVTVEYIGSWSNNYKLVEGSLIQKYDLIVGIGKNVQYCLVSGTPVYLYDYFGGCGYLNGKNYDVARFNNFSGRGFKKKKSRIIAMEILTGYDAAVRFHRTRRSEFVSEYGIDNVLSNIFSSIPKGKKNNSSKFSEEYVNYLVSMQIMLHDRFVAWGGNTVLGNNINNLNTRIAEQEQALELIKKTLEYKIGYRLLRPFRTFRAILKRTLIH